VGVRPPLIVNDIDVDEARLIHLERLLLHGTFALRRSQLGLQRAQVAHPMPMQAATQARTAGLGVDELPRHHQQVVQRQQQRAPDLHNHILLRLRQCRPQMVRRVRTILHTVPSAPAPDRVHGHSISLRKRAVAHLRRRSLNLAPNLRRGRCIGMQSDHHRSPPDAFISARLQPTTRNKQTIAPNPYGIIRNLTNTGKWRWARWRS